MMGKIKEPFTSFGTLKKYRRIRLIILSSDIERERETLINYLDFQKLSNPQKVEKAQKLEELIIEYFRLNTEGESLNDPVVVHRGEDEK